MDGVKLGTEVTDTGLTGADHNELWWLIEMSRRKIVAVAVFSLVVGVVLGIVAGIQMSRNGTVFARAGDHKVYLSQEEVRALAGNLALSEELAKAEIKIQRKISGERQKLAEEEVWRQNRQGMPTADRADD